MVAAPAADALDAYYGGGKIHKLDRSTREAKRDNGSRDRTSECRKTKGRGLLKRAASSILACD